MIDLKQTYFQKLGKEIAKKYDDDIVNDIAELLDKKYGIILDKELFLDVLKSYSIRKTIPIIEPMIKKGGEK